MTKTKISIFFSLMACALFLLNTQFCAASGKDKYDQLLESSQLHVKMMEPEKAIADLTAAIKLNPKYYRAYHLRSLAYAELNLYEKELADMTRAIECYPACPLYRDRGAIHFRYGHFKEAVEDYTKALSMQPGDQNTLRARARAYLALKDNARAITDFENALKTMNAGSIRMVPDLMDNLGKLYIKTKQDQKALDVFTLLIKRYPNMGRGYYGRAEVYKLQGKPDLAKKDLEKAHELDYAMDPGLQKSR